MPIVAAVLLARFIDLAVGRAPLHRLVGTGVAYVALGLVSAVVTVVCVWRSTKLAWTITDSLRHELADFVLHADLGFHRDHTRGELVSRADDDVTAMANFLSQFVARAIAVLAIATTSICTLTSLHPQLGVVLAVCMSGVLLIVWLQRNRSVMLAVADRDARGRVSGLIEERVNGAEEIAALGAGAYSLGRFAAAAQAVVVAGRRLTFRQMASYGVARVALTCTEVIMLVVGARAYIAHEVSLGAVFLGVRFAAATRGPIENLMWRLLEFVGATGSASRVLALLAARPTHPERVVKLPSGPLDVELRNLTLVYDEAEGAVLDNVDLRIAAGRSLGLVGRSGSGKTSLGRVILRLVPASAGDVAIGGVAIATVVEDDLRHRVAGVPQEVQLFPGTIRENVSMFDATIPDEAIVRALGDVGLGPWFEALGVGLDAQLLSRQAMASAMVPDATSAVVPEAAASDGDPSHDSAGGDGRPDERVGMSAGEAQLLSLARTLVRDPDVVVLDEATSRIDPHTQQLVKAAVVRLLAHRTAIVIAHRLDTLDVCDDIAVLDEGRIVEHGERRVLAADPMSRFARLIEIGGMGDASVDDAFDRATAAAAVAVGVLGSADVVGSADVLGGSAGDGIRK